MKKGFLLFLSILLITTTVFSCIQIMAVVGENESLNVQTENMIEAEPIIQEEVINENPNLVQLSAAQNLSLWLSVFKPTEEQSKEIALLIKNGADTDILIKICEFWEDTDAPFSIVAQIYAKAPEIEALEQIMDHNVWIERAYNELTGNENNLSVEEVKAYMSSGVSLDDLYAANRAARKSDINPKEVLDRLVSGENWVEIIAPQLESELSTDEQESINGHELLDSLIIERKTGSEAVKILKTALENNDSVMGVYAASVAEETETDDDEVTSDGGMNNEEQ